MFLAFKNGVKSIQITGYNGARMVFTARKHTKRNINRHRTIFNPERFCDFFVQQNFFLRK